MLPPLSLALAASEVCVCVCVVSNSKLFCIHFIYFDVNRLALFSSEDAFWNKKWTRDIFLFVFCFFVPSVEYGIVILRPSRALCLCLCRVDKASFWLFFTFWSIIWIYAKQTDTVSRSHRDTIGCLSNCIAIFSPLLYSCMNFDV